MSDITYKSTWTGDPNAHPLSSFSDSMTGSCLCGSITVTIHDTELFTKPRGHLWYVYYLPPSPRIHPSTPHTPSHCSNCRKVSGSFASSNLAIERQKVTYEDQNATLKVYADTDTGSGKCVKRLFCGNCGSPVMSQPEVSPNMWVLKMGMFPRIPKPECESFAGHRQGWEREGEGMVQYRYVRGRERLGE